MKGLDTISDIGIKKLFAKHDILPFADLNYHWGFIDFGKLYKLIDDNTKFKILVDYDCDGLSSGSIIYQFLKYLGKDVEVHLYQRSQGFSVAKNDLDAERMNIILDRGSVEASQGQFGNLPFIVVDHHDIVQDEISLQDDQMIINPRFNPNETYLPCTSAIAYEIVRDHFDNKHIRSLLTLGCISDISVLDVEYQDIIREHLLSSSSQVLRNAKDPLNIKFRVSPAINSCARVGTTGDAWDYLNNPEDLASWKKCLATNTKRKEMLSQAREVSRIESINNVAFVEFSPKNQSIMSILASRNLDRFSICVTFVIDKEIVKFSVRSRTNLFGLYNELKQLGFKVGGHNKAGGGTFALDRLAEFIDIVSSFRFENDPLVKLSLDSLVSLRENQGDLLDYLDCQPDLEFQSDGEWPSLTKGFRKVNGILFYGKDPSSIGKLSSWKRNLSVRF